MNAVSSSIGGRKGASFVPWLAALIVAVAAAYGLGSLWPPLHAAWSGIYGAFSHGYLALALSVWLAVAYWQRRQPSQLQPNWVAAGVLLVLVVALAAMDLLFLQSSRLALLPLLFLACVACVFGVECMRVLLWPALYLYCALPQWWVINSSLQTLTSVVVGGLIEITRLPAYVEGNFIHVPAGVFEIASGCSGLSYLVAALSLAAFYAFMYLTHWRNRLWLMGAAALLAMLSNVARVYSLIVIGIVTDMKHYLVTVDHLYFGWVIFGVAMLPVFWLARRFDEAELATPPAEAAPSQHLDAAIVVAPKTLLAAFVAATLLLIPRIASVPEVAADAPVADLPNAVGEWLQTPAATSAWRPGFINAREQRVDYTKGSDRIEVYRAVYPYQTAERRVVRGDNVFFGLEWRQAEQRSIAADVTGFASVNESRGYVGEQERLTWFWYFVAGEVATSKLEAKAREVQGLLQGRRDAMAVAVAADCVPDCTAARTRLREFMRESAASLQRL